LFFYSYVREKFSFSSTLPQASGFLGNAGRNAGVFWDALPDACLFVCFDIVSPGWTRVGGNATIGKWLEKI
jgi:hypothetical protein